MQKTLLRQTMRAWRKNLSLADQIIAAQKVTEIITNDPLIITCQAIGIYCSQQEELATSSIITALLSLNKQCYLPCLHPYSDRGLFFSQYNENTMVIKNCFGITEPQTAIENAFSIHHLDIVFLPLIAFDLSGGRLGMGGGYYDKTFAYKRQKKHAKPLLIGLAYSGQQVDHVPHEPWDICLDAVITEKGKLNF